MRINVDYDGRQVSYTTIVGSVIRGFRQAEGLQQAEMAAAMGLGRSWYGKLERGDHAWTSDHVFLAAPLIELQPARIHEMAATVVRRIESYVPVVGHHQLEGPRRAMTVHQVLQLDRAVRGLGPGSLD